MRYLGTGSFIRAEVPHGGKPTYHRDPIGRYRVLYTLRLQRMLQPDELCANGEVATKETRTCKASACARIGGCGETKSSVVMIAPFLEASPHSRSPPHDLSIRGFRLLFSWFLVFSL